MAQIKIIEKDRLDLIIAEKGFLPALLTKDYYISLLLYILKDIKGIHFKGGTALQKTILDYSRLSEDIDFTLTRNLEDSYGLLAPMIQSLEKKLSSST